ncbi:sugar transferase [Pseudoalteromonas sp. MEBiC 03607]|uniref:sugar transferase n=1 Tax=unclassified Pseudoalteromonas TaxID=194690 RepID=UPI001093A55A|nr:MULTISPECIES: sugar transferase [unclassified Pseudoalteromonas]MCF2901340.1 sugar transferase [Pseudoalteromonas sp. OFAV1]TGV19330.1 sugar transferase [Pseudoalteromonas sp. MEBiC 03607]
MNKTNKILKRLFDVALSFFGLLLFWPIIFIAWCVASLETKSNGFFIQVRVGLNGNLFHVIKIKTMKKVQGVSTSVTSKNDCRITKSGSFFRNTKIDELPQLWNVLIGDMSFVGPRPDVPGYADQLLGDDRIVLSIRPGITGPASIKYKNEEELLANQNDPEDYNRKVIWPDKVNVNKAYIENYSFFNDIKYIWQTIVG